jgi:hypothetical protein
MGSLPRILISLPLIVMPLLAATPHASASQAMRPSNAVRLLAKSRTVDARCQYLVGPDHQQLADYVARAEVASAQLDGVAATKSALAAGNSEGKTMACDAGSKAMVSAVLTAARRAEKSLGPQLAALEKKARANQRSRPQSQPRKKTRVVAMQPPPADGSGNLSGLSGSNGGLDLYTRHAAAYYIERRCGFLASRDTMAFWKLIVARHKDMIARFGGGAVTVAKARAEDAGAAACGSQSQVFVRSAWNDIQRHR